MLLIMDTFFFITYHFFLINFFPVYLSSLLLLLSIPFPINYTQRIIHKQSTCKKSFSWEVYYLFSRTVTKLHTQLWILFFSRNTLWKSLQVNWYSVSPFMTAGGCTYNEIQYFIVCMHLNSFTSFLIINMHLVSSVLGSILLCLRTLILRLLCALTILKKAK